jgi:hypothetical protein
MAMSYRIAICPFEHIEPAYGAVGLCIPGVGTEKYDIMGQELYTLLSSKLLPMQVNADGSILSQALAIATDKSVPNGYELLEVLLKTLVVAFDSDQLEVVWPKYVDYDSPLLFASAIEQTVIMASKRQQTVSAKNTVTQFLDGIISYGNHDY